VAHAYNPTYSWAEDRGSKPGQANSLEDPILKNPSQKKEGTGRVAQGVSPESKLQYKKKEF
jgi:hypothetical protein